MGIQLDSLIREGRVSDALRHVRLGGDAASADDLLRRAEVHWLAGQLDEAQRCVRAVERHASADGDKARLARSAFILASCCYDAGNQSIGIEHSCRALRLAQSVTDSTLAGLVAAQLLVWSSEAPSRERLAWASQARRSALRAGDTHVTARVHAAFGRVEGRAGNFGVALRHLEVAKEVLRAEPNYWIGATIDLDIATILGLIGEFEKARRLTEQAAASAAKSGWLKGRAVASANLAYLSVMLGDFEGAIHYVRDSPVEFRDHPNFRKALSETLAQAEFCRMSFDVAEGLVSSLDNSDSTKA